MKLYANSVNPYVLLLLIASTCALVACGESSPQGDTQLQNNNVDTQKPLGENALVKAGSDDAFLAYYRAGLEVNENRLQTSQSSEQVVFDKDGNAITSIETVAQADIASNDISGDNSSESKNFGISSTNLIEEGVDEVDFVKQNNSHIYTTTSNKNGNRINVFAKPSTNKLTSLALPMQDGKPGTFKGFFLKADTLYSLRQASYANWQFNNTYAYNNGKIALDVINVAIPATLDITQKYSWDGDYKTARRINDNIYVVSSSSVKNPWMCGGFEPMPLPIPEPMPDLASNAEESRIASVSSDEAYPPYYCKAPTGPLTVAQIAERMPADIYGNKVKPADCLIPKDYDKDSKLNGNITLITKIDLKDKTNHQTTCIAGSAENVYMSQKALYLAGHDYHNGSDDTIIPLQQSTDTGTVVADVNVTAHTLISKFDLKDDGVKYAGTGKVAGYINWNAPSFSMNEYNDVLRVVTTAQSWQNNSNMIANMVHTLKPADDKLELKLVTTLPNAVRPKPIGKPNERVQGIRFMGDTGYVVTFRQTDPLYKINLENAEDPFIQGELEMPGFSAYLQQLNNKYLLGVGYMANENGGRNGVQVTVFDVSGDAPIIVDNKIYKSNTSAMLPVASDSRAITTLSDSQITKVAIPYKYRTYNSETGSLYLTKALEYNIDLSTGKFMDSKDRTLVEDTSYIMGFYANKERVLMDGNETYYSLFDGSLLRYLWNELPD